MVDAPLPTAGWGEVRVRVLASSVEYTDVVIRRHVYPQTMHRRRPFVLGYDVVGEIDQLGDGVRGFQLGDRVADMTVLGSNAAWRTLRARDLTRVPAGVDAAEAAALVLSWTLAASPDILLLDEPSGALDSLTRGNLQDEILQIWETRKRKPSS